MAVFNPNRKRNIRGEQRQLDLLRAAAAVFGRLGYHEATTNTIASEAGVSPATLYHFFPNKEAIASSLAAMYARQMADAERAIDPSCALSFSDAIHALVELCIRFNRERPEFHTLVLDAPLSDVAHKEKHALGEVFVDFIADRLRRERPALPKSEATHHGRIALMIFRGILDELTTAPVRERPRLQEAMHDAILRYLEPVISRPAKKARDVVKSGTAKM